MSKVWEGFTTKKQWKKYLQDLMDNDYALVKAIETIYNLQTQEEKQKRQSLDDNQVGFTKYDAQEMGIIAEKIIRKQPLTKGEVAKSRNKMKKYWGQLMAISKHKMALKRQEDAQNSVVCEHNIIK